MWKVTKVTDFIIMKKETNSRVYKLLRLSKIRQERGDCMICGIRKGENAKGKHRKRNHGQQPKYKNKI